MSIKNVVDAAKALASVAGDEFVLRGALVGPVAPRFRRILRAKPNLQATLADVPRSNLLLDLDGTPSAFPWYDPHISDEEDTVDAVNELILDLLPIEFHRVSCWFGFTASHGVKPGMNLRLFFCLSRPLETQELKAWLGHLRSRKLDTAVFSPAQQILVAPPVLASGVTDPVRVRRGFVTGLRHIVVPPPRAVILAARHRSQRTRSASTTSAASPAKSGTNEPSLSAKSKRFKSYVRVINRIGDGPGQDGLHSGIMSAIGAWVRANGPETDASELIRDITNQINTTTIDPAAHNTNYVANQLAELPRMIADVCEMEFARQASAAAAHSVRQRAIVAATRDLVMTSADEAAKAASSAIAAFIENIPALRSRRDGVWAWSHQEGFGREYPAPRRPAAWRRRGAVIVDLGVGKTQFAVAEIVALVAGTEDIRVTYVVPAHKLANEVANRFNAVAGFDIASVWRGLNQPDPNDPGATMCRRPQDADVVQRAGGDLVLLCGSKARGFCPFHPERDGPCAYIRQQNLKPSVWVVPAAMLTNAVPFPMQRDAILFERGGKAHTARPPAVDLLVLDEAPFLNLLGGFDDASSVHVSPSWVAASLHRSTRGTKREEHDAVIEKALLALQGAVAALLAGGAAPKEYYARERGRDIDDESPEFRRAAELLFDVVGPIQVNPEQTGDDLAEHLRDRVGQISRVRAIQRLLRTHDDVLSSTASITCLARSQMPEGTPAVRLRWREDIHPSWLDCPVLYLDGTAKTQLAERWLGKIDELVTAKAAAPHMKIIQVDDRPFGYRTIIAGDDPALARAAMGHQRRLSSLMVVARAGTGGTGALIGPKRLIEQMTGAGLVPDEWNTATYGSLRGVDDHKDVAVAVIVSRQLPAPAQVELITEIILGQDVRQIESNDWYPTTSIIRLMSDGTGRLAETNCHPDPNVEMIRWLICEAEGLQGIGRPRGVRRNSSNPVLMFVLNQIDLGHQPVSSLLTWDEINELCGPTMLMASQGCVPKMWTDIAHMIGRWNDLPDPAMAARAWYRDNPAEKAALAELFATGRSKNPFTGAETTFRRVSLGLVGKNHRYVWLTGDRTVDDARAMLDKGFCRAIGS